MSAATFTTPSGAQCLYDVWYAFSEPLLVCPKKKLQLLPTRDEAEQCRLQIKLADGRVWPWVPFYAPEERKNVRAATHWRLPAAGYYEI